MPKSIGPQSSDDVLEIGNWVKSLGGDFRKIVQRIYFVKIIESIGRLSGERRQALGYINIRTKFGYRYEGWPDAARFDANISQLQRLDS